MLPTSSADKAQPAAVRFEPHLAGQGAQKGRGMPYSLALLVLFVFCLAVPPSAGAATAEEDGDESSLSHAPTLELVGGSRRVPLGPFLQVLEDPEGDLGVEDMERPEVAARFVQTRDEVPSFGFTPSTFWLRFTLRDLAALHVWLLEIAYPLLDQVDLYEPDTLGGWMIRRGGDRQTFGRRDVPSRYFVFRLDTIKGREGTYYLRVRTDSSTILPLTIWEERAYLARDHDAQILLGLYYGVVAVMALYNFFLFLSLRDRNYLFYVFYILCYMLFQGGLNGLTYEYLWPNSPQWNEISLPLSMGMVTFASLLFASAFLDVRRRLPGLYRWYYPLMPLSLLAAACPFFLSYGTSIKVGTPVAILAIVAMLVAGHRSWRDGYKPARFFLTAWTVFLLGQLGSAVNKGYGLLPSNWFTLHAGQAGSMLEVVLLSLALADRINVLRLERQQALERVEEELGHTAVLNTRLTEANRTLEERVTARTTELQDANAQLRAMDRLKTDFLTSVSHEIRTPMTSVLGFATMIKLKLETVLFPALDTSDARVGRAMDKVRRNVGIIEDEAQRLTNLINDVLDIARMESGKAVWQDRRYAMEEVVRKASAVVRPLARSKGLELRMDIQEDLPVLSGDPERMQQVAINLLSNAVKFTDSGSITCSVTHTDGQVTVSVADQGVGIAPEDQERIFDKFRQVGDTLVAKPEGTGLGLPICKQIVEHYAGRIWVESAPGEGSVFAFTVPVAQQDRGA